MTYIAERTHGHPSKPRPSAAPPPFGARCMTTKPARFQMFDEALRHDLRHDLVGVVDPFAAIKPQDEGERVGDVFRRGGHAAFGHVGHWSRVTGRLAPTRHDLR